jgi:hypothetical protein
LDEFRTVAEALGVDTDNVDETREALLESGCVTVPAGAFVLTRFGRRYLDCLLQQGAPGVCAMERPANGIAVRCPAPSRARRGGAVE